MVPLLLISKSPETIEAYIQGMAKTHKYSFIVPFYRGEASFSIDLVREVSAFAARAEKDRTMVILYEFDTALDAAQNAFLKTLEDRSMYIQFVITGSNEQRFLPTIMSRVKKIKLNTNSNVDLNKQKDKAVLNSDTVVNFLVTSQKISEEDTAAFLETSISAIRTDMIADVNNKNFSDAFKKAEYLQKLMMFRYSMLTFHLKPELTYDEAVLQAEEDGILS